LSDQRQKVRVYFMFHPRRAFAWVDWARESPGLYLAVDRWFGVFDTLGSEIVPTQESYRLLPVHFDSVHLSSLPLQCGS
jgi:hypothetical protein